VRFASETLSDAIDTACVFIREGLDVVKLESDLGFTIEAHIFSDLCPRAYEGGAGR
jgi:hypothetical protein